jgi:hypothetical protein
VTATTSRAYSPPPPAPPAESGAVSEPPPPPPPPQHSTPMLVIPAGAVNVPDVVYVWLAATWEAIRPCGVAIETVYDVAPGLACTPSGVTWREVAALAPCPEANDCAADCARVAWLSAVHGDTPDWKLMLPLMALE